MNEEHCGGLIKQNEWRPEDEETVNGWRGRDRLRKLGLCEAEILRKGGEKLKVINEQVYAQVDCKERYGEV